MNVIEEGEQFRKWRKGLGSGALAMKVRVRLVRLESGNPGDAKPVGAGVVEMRIDFGPGYRMYYTKIGKNIFFMLGGGDKSSQQGDIDRAKELAAKRRRAG